MSILSKLMRLDEDEAVSSSNLTYLNGLRYRNSAPQNVRPKPMKASTYEEEYAEKSRANAPDTNIK